MPNNHRHHNWNLGGALQVRAQTTQSKLESIQGVLENYNTLSRESFLARPDVAEIQRLGFADFEALSPEQKYVFHLAQSQLVLHAQSVLLHYQAGLISETDYNAWMAYIASVLRCPGSARWWESCSWVYTVSIRDALEAQLSATRGEPSYVDRMPFFDDLAQPGAIEPAGTQSR